MDVPLAERKWDGGQGWYCHLAGSLLLNLFDVAYNKLGSPKFRPMCAVTPGH